MSKQKVVSSLLLSTVVLGGLAFYSTTTVKAESLEPDVTSVNASDATNKPVVPNEEGGDFLAEEELEDDDTLEEELNEKAEEVTEPSSPEALLQPRAMMSDSETSGMEEIPMNDEPSDNTEEKVEKQQSPLIQTSNADYKSGKDQEKLRTSVSINLLKAEEGQIQWKVTFDTSEWSFNVKHGGVYFILPNGLDLTKIVDNNQHDITASFPTDINDYRNSGQEKYRFFSSKQGLDNENGFNSQWNWSAGQANPSETVNSWKSGNRLSKIYFINQITDTTELTYTLTAKVTEPNQQSFPLLAVMKSFTYTNSKSTEVTSLGAREITLEKEKTLPPKENPKPEPEAPKPDAPQAPSAPESPTEEPKKEDAPQTPQAPSTPEKQPEVPESPNPETPDAPSTPKDEPQAPSIPEEKPQVPEEPKQEAPSAPSTPEKQPEAPESPTEEPKKEDAPAPSTPEKQPEVPESPNPETPDAPSTPKDEPQVPSIPEEQPKETPAPEEPKKEDTPQTPQAPSTPKEEAPKEEVPTPPAPSVPEEQPKETPTPEVPKQEDVQPEAPKSDKVESDKQMPETKKPDMKQPKADDMPKEQKPKADEPKAEQPQMDKPQMEAPKKDSEAPKSDKVETDKPMPETKQPDMKQPKADKPEAEKAQMPRTEGMKPESKASMMPKAEAPKATLPNTGEASSAIGWLGGALATLATGLYLFKNKKEE
ncbi:TPA: LPXTG cell wall anchor domain-containing protein [Streptococcus suis]|uniref:LPXTG cell wall anchor domain-containing protein n=1 Tax=Streptococcus suis TaxID=1307 RepID=UPI0007695B67|nr:LPXTG cell wall anchor domain-containing protein [Streptococcus suis]MBS8035132.1 LPXTG cell wall anchor domain-containing protein [Streptococcus suis]MCH4697368.1 LPXTG cell wall anchor domain-containing protein [Streptococcus suis]MDG3236317.1 LPXTG cell wall anchor domain-containing protein [Streptococcus suis]MDW8677025.1 LPXTG cell wall anchor domain-containing protein [Streptococcus suis]NRH09513.1 LPXTG cell wall anchor domain-containing protein [Streptococcus suis]